MANVQTDKHNHFWIPRGASFKRKMEDYLCHYVFIWHMGAEAPYSFKEVSGGPPYCKLTTRHHIFWYYVSPNQTCKVLGDFGPKS